MGSALNITDGLSGLPDAALLAAVICLIAEVWIAGDAFLWLDILDPNSIFNRGCTRRMLRNFVWLACPTSRLESMHLLRN